MPGDQDYHTTELEKLCAEDERLLLTAHPGRYPDSDVGVEVRRIFSNLRSTAIENFNEQFKGSSTGMGRCLHAADEHPSLHPRGDLGLSTHVVVPFRAWLAPADRLETVPQSRIRNYDQASANIVNLGAPGAWRRSRRREIGRHCLWLIRATFLVGVEGLLV